MVRSTSTRTAALFRAYYGLLAISLALSTVLISRQVPGARNGSGEIILPAPHDPNAPRRYAPMINWGGQKR
jgi:hypothetical protein